LAAARLVASQLFGVNAADPVALGLATLVLLDVEQVDRDQEEVMPRACDYRT
jgi:hypothetical protein